MKNLTFALLIGLGAAVPGFCSVRVVMPEPGMAGELAVAAAGFAGLVFLFRKRKN
ncbi:MAG: hypothetical protein ABSE42_20905 [Bryobacteraceae bacterium]|jgi:hypothetical protein